MQDEKPIEHGYVSPWFSPEAGSPNEDDYFPPYYPVDDKLITPAIQDEAQQRDN